MKRLVLRFFAKVPVARIGLLAAFIAAQLAGVQIYLNHEKFFENVNLTVLREAYLPSLLHRPNVSGASAGGAATSVPVLIYHGVVDRPDGSNVLIEDFREQMFALKAAGYQAVSMADFLGFVKEGRRLPERSFLLTFDDGRKDSYYPVDPIIKALGFHASMFVITGQSFRRGGEPSRYYLDRGELAAMRDSGRWDIEAHTRDYHGLTDITAGGEKGHLYSNLRWLADQNRLETQEEFVARITADLRGAQEDLLRELKVRASVFAFPFGDYGQDTVNNPAAQGAVLEGVSKVYAAAFVQEQASGTPSSQNRPGADPTTLKRIEVYPNWTPANVLKMVAIGAPKQAFFRDDFTDYQGWLTSYGSVQYLGDNRMRLGAQPDGNSASVVLDGANDWTDYTYNARFQVGSVGTNVSLVGRYRDENNFVTCTVTPERVRIEQRAGGVNRVLAEARYPVGPMPVSSLTMAVTGSAVACTGPKRVAAAIDHAAAATLRSGGIGVKIWNPTKAAASVAMAEIYVTPAV